MSFAYDYLSNLMIFNRYDVIQLIRFDDEKRIDEDTPLMALTNLVFKIIIYTMIQHEKQVHKYHNLKCHINILDINYSEIKI